MGEMRCVTKYNNQKFRPVRGIFFNVLTPDTLNVCGEEAMYNNMWGDTVLLVDADAVMQQSKERGSLALYDCNGCSHMYGPVWESGKNTTAALDKTLVKCIKHKQDCYTLSHELVLQGCSIPVSSILAIACRNKQGDNLNFHGVHGSFFKLFGKHWANVTLRDIASAAEENRIYRSHFSV